MSVPIELDNLDDLVQQYRSGKSMKQLAGEVGVSRKALTRKFVNHGVEIRGRGEAGKLHWQGLKLDPAAIERQCSAAWAATRGRKQSLAEKVKRARTRMEHLTHIGALEQELADAIRGRGVVVTQQLAIERYNIDLALYSSRVAVELYTSQIPTNNGRHAVIRKRTEYLLDLGWSVLSIYAVAYRDVGAMADAAVAFAEERRRNKALGSEHRMIRGDGKPTSIAGADLDR